MTLFPNGFKEEAPEKQRPDYWGGINFGDGTDVVRVSAWLEQGRYGNPRLSGATGFPQPGKSEAEMQAADATLANKLKSGEVSKGMPKGKGKAATGRAD